MSAGRERLVQERDQALRDLVDLDRQVAAGELPEAVAAELRAGYERTAATALAGLEEAVEAAGEGAVPSSGRSGARIRWSAYVLALAAAIFAAVVLLPTYLGERVAGGAVSGNEALGTPADPSAAPRDLSTVTNEEMEEVVAQNPEVVDMRLALAHRYLDAEQYLSAARHYATVLDREPRNVAALAHQGWLLMQLGAPGDAMESVDEALRQNPRDAEALWFRANIALYGLSDTDSAISTLEQLQERPDIEPAVRAQVEALLAAAREEAARG